jgi:glycosyltransferase involved in cell wall biosynthesis
MPDTSRVLYFYPSLQFDTGSPKAMVQFIDLLDRRIFTPVYCAQGEGPLTEVLASRGIEIVPWRQDMISHRRPVAAVRAIWRQARLLKQWKIDLVHANCFPWNSDLLLGAAIVGIPVITHVHNRFDVPFQNLTRFASRKVLFCSDAAMRNTGRLDRVAAKAEILHNVIDVDAWKQGHSIRRSLGIGEGDIAIGTVAQIVQRKGIDILLETARMLLRERKNLVFVIAGPQMETEEEFGRRMLAAAQDPAFGGRVRFLGSRADIPDLMASLDVFFLPTRAEPFGIVILEAMAAGLPVVASKIGGIPEILNSPEIGTLVDPLTSEAFANSLQEVLSRPDGGKGMGAKARESLRGRFDTLTGGARLKKIYLEVLGVSRRHA